MQFTTTLIAALAASMAAASPVAAPAATVDVVKSNDIPLIDLWQQPKFLDLKFTGSSTVGTCNNLKGTGFNNKVRSGKSKPGFRCTIWVAADCKETGFSFNADPGVASLPSWIDKKASSWKCVKDT